MSLYAQFETNKDVEKQGIRIEYHNDDGEPPAVFVVARAGGANDAYGKRLEVLLRPHRRAIQTETISVKTLEALIMEAFVETVLKDWENIKDRNGVEMAFTKENAITLFTDLPALYEDLKAQAEKISLFRQDALEAAAKN